jgi:hypothetical protein
MSGLTATALQRIGTRTMLASSGRSSTGTGRHQQRGHHRPPQRRSEVHGHPSPVSTTEPPKAIGSSQARAVDLNRRAAKLIERGGR